MKVGYVEGGGGVRIATLRTGDQRGPLIVFIHGFCQSHYSFTKQYDAPALAAFDMLSYDLRGHGLSEKPVDAAAYQEAASWADDLHAVIESVPDKPVVLVAWSYAGYIVGDYLARHGGQRICGINLVAASIRKHPDVAHAIGPAFKTHVADLVDDDLLRNLHGVKKLGVDCSYHALDAGLGAVYEQIACMTPHYVRKAMLDRVVVQNDAWRDFTGSLLISHGRHDSVLLPEMADVSRAVAGRGDISWYDAGHSPFLEQPVRFNAELSAFVLNSAVPSLA
jgi:pimeloyl-ACP methyl ester carboxylesterase